MKSLYKHLMILTVIFIFTSALNAADLPSTAKLLPSDTIAILEIDNFSQSQNKFQQTSISKLYNDQAMQPFIANLKEEFQKTIQGEDNIFVKTVIDSKILPKKRVTFALILDSNAVKNNEPTAFFITQWGENIEKIKELINESQSKAQQQGWHITKDQYRSIEITTLSAEDSERLNFGFAGNLSYCCIDDTLMGSEDIEILKFAIAHLKGADSPTLADEDVYNNAARSVKQYNDITLFINIKKILATFANADTTGQFQTITSNLGIDNLSSISASAGIAQNPQCSLAAKMNIKIDGPKKGIFKMLDLKSLPVRAPQFLSDSVYSMVMVNLELPSSYNELYKMLAAFNPGFAAMLNTPLIPPTQPDQAPLQLKNSIIDYLGSQIIYAQQLNKPFKKGKTPAKGIVAIETTDHINLEKSLKQIHSQLLAANQPDSTKELLGRTIYLLDVQTIPFFATRTPGQEDEEIQDVDLPKYAFAVLDTHLIMGQEESVETAIRKLNTRDVPSLETTKWFAKAKTNIDSAVGTAVIEDSAAAAEVLWWTFKQLEELPQSDQYQGTTQSIQFGLLSFFKPELLPDFDAVKKYFGISIFQGKSTDEGFNFQYKYLDSQAIK